MSRPHVPRIPLDPRDEVFGAFLRMAATVHPGQPLVDVVREACVAWMTGDPALAGRMAAREGAWRDAGTRARRLIGAALRQAAGAYSAENALDGE
jgi:hypothetical protein